MARTLSYAAGDFAALDQRSPARCQRVARLAAQLQRFSRALHPVLSADAAAPGDRRLARPRWRCWDWAGACGASGAATCASCCASAACASTICSRTASALPLLKGALALDAVLGTNYGPRSPGTVLSLLYRVAASQGADALALPQGGLGAVSEALAGAARAAGAQIRTGAPVARILVREDRAAGVVLASGEEILAPQRDFERRSQDHVPRACWGVSISMPGSCVASTQLRARGLTREAAPGAASGCRSSPGSDAQALRGRLLVAPSLGLHRARLQPRQVRRVLGAPMLEITVPSCARSGTGARRQACDVGDRAVRALQRGGRLVGSSGRRFTESRDRHASRRMHRGCAIRSGRSELLTPPDIEREFRITGGHWHHAELALDQFLMVRPVPGAAQYQTPVAGLFLCGAGCHPGGGVMGTCGPQRGAAGAWRGRLGRYMLTESEPHYRQPLLKTPFHERCARLEPARQLRAVGRLYHGRCFHERRAGILRDPQRDLAL